MLKCKELFNGQLRDPVIHIHGHEALYALHDQVSQAERPGSISPVPLALD